MLNNIQNQRLTKASRASDSVHVGFPVLWNIQVYHQVDFLCIYTSGSLGGDKREKREKELMNPRPQDFLREDKNKSDRRHMESTAMKALCVSHQVSGDEHPTLVLLQF